MDIPGVNDETAGVYEEENDNEGDDTTGVDDAPPADMDDEPVVEASEDKRENGDDRDTDTYDCTYQGMRLTSQSKQEYNMFNIDGTQAEEVVMLTMGKDNKICELDMPDAEYLLLTETLG